VQPAVAEAVELLRACLPTTLTLKVRLEADGAAVAGDATEVQQVVMNLCTNAAHAMDERGTLEVARDTVAIAHDRTLTPGALGPSAYVRLAVRDSGSGMDAATMERIFEPFFTTRPVGGGTGLGLSTVHGIVTLHGGALNVSSRPGHGSCFEVYWPQRVAPAAAAEAPAVAASRGNGEAVLLVDDEAALVRMGEDMLAALGYEPVGFEAPGAALAAWTR
jgi:signal transduction histidine kinase